MAEDTQNIVLAAIWQRDFPASFCLVCMRTRPARPVLLSTPVQKIELWELRPNVPHTLQSVVPPALLLALCHGVNVDVAWPSLSVADRWQLAYATAPFLETACMRGKL